jgi:predicted nucleotidyltransferase component of viral defense system
MHIEALKAFSLVGGTALSLRYGHRTSIDLDLFYHEKFDHDTIITALKVEFGNNYSTESKHVRWGIFCYLDDVKVDIVYYPHLPIQKIEVIKNIRMYSDEDIIAMKLNAILGRGRKKDFWDLYELLHHYTLEKMIHFHEAKFPEQNLLITIPQAITYFDEAEESEDPVSLKGQTWQTVKKYIQRQVRDFLK